MIGPSDIPTEDKTITVCYGKDMTNIDFVNFVCASREVARVCPQNSTVANVKGETILMQIHVLFF